MSNNSFIIDLEYISPDSTLWTLGPDVNRSKMVRVFKTIREAFYPNPRKLEKRNKHNRHRRVI